MMNKRHFKLIFKEFNFGHIIEIRKGNMLFVGCINTYPCTKNYYNFDECLEATRSMVLNMPEWLNDVAIKQNINFSQVLQEALMEKVGVR